MYSLFSGTNLHVYRLYLEFSLTKGKEFSQTIQYDKQNAALNLQMKAEKHSTCFTLSPGNV